MKRIIGYEELMYIKDTPMGREILEHGEKAVNYYGYIMPFVIALRKEVDDWHGDILQRRQYVFNRKET